MKAFDNSKTEIYNQETKEKWGETPAYKEYEAKTKGYSKDKWCDLTREMDGVMEKFSLCMKSGETPESSEAQSLVKALQEHISENYYLCTNQILAGLGPMYVADERFRENIDRHADGTAQFICEAIAAYCGK
jgi:hypothetical protein